MQINLKQAEIVAAIKGYISNQGINLANKEVAIKFTAGRGDTGLSADIGIEDAELPDFGSDDEAPAVTATIAPIRTLAAVPTSIATEIETSPVVTESAPAESSAKPTAATLFS